MASRRRLLTAPQRILVAVVLLFAIAAGITVTVTLPTVVRAASPDIPVTAYLRALVTGDVPAVLRLGRITPPAGRSLLTARAYAAASDRITSFRITGTAVSGGTARVTTRIAQGGAAYTATFTALRERGVPGLAPWRLAPQRLPQVAVTVAGPARSVTVAGVALGTKNGGAVASALPGSYVVAGAATADYAAAPRTAVALLGRAGGAVNLVVGLTPKGKAVVQASAQAWLAKCAASSELHPSGCPFSAVPTPGVTYSAGRWAITAQPTLTIGTWSPSLGGWQVGSGPGSVTFTVHTFEGGEPGTASTGSRAFVVTGTAVPTTSGVAFVPSPSYRPTTDAA